MPDLADPGWASFRRVLQHVSETGSTADVRLLIGQLVVRPHVRSGSDLAQVLVELHYRSRDAPIRWQTIPGGDMQLEVRAIDRSLRWIDVEVLGWLETPVEFPVAEIRYPLDHPKSLMRPIVRRITL